MGHVGKQNIYFSWPFVKLCLLLNYMGQGAWIIRSQGDAALASVADLNPFFLMLPEPMRPFAVLLGAAAAIIASQALITGSYTLVSEAILLDLLPHLEIRFPSDTKGQLYISAVNTVLWIGCSLVVLYFRSGARIESAYGLAITLTMLMTTPLLTVYLRKLKKKPLLAHNLVYLMRDTEHPELIDRDVLYSILDKDTKRAQAYWFLSVNVLSEPYTANYELETFDTDCVFRVRLNLGFKRSQRINIYLRQIVQDLQASGELLPQHKKYSIYPDSTVGTFKFCAIRKSVTTKTELSGLDERILNAKYSIRRRVGSRERWYGLDTSVIINENVPLVAQPQITERRITRKVADG